MARKISSILPNSAKREEFLLLEERLLRENIENKGKNYRIRKFLKRSIQLGLVYSVIIALIASIVLLWKYYILSYDWLAVNTVTLETNGVFTPEQTFRLLQIKDKNELASTNTRELEQRLIKCPAIRNAMVSHVLKNKPTLYIDVEARIPIAWVDCPELSIVPNDTTYGIFIDKEGVLFPSIKDVHEPLIKNSTLPAISIRPNSTGQLTYGVPIAELKAPVKLLDLLSGNDIATYLPGIVSISTPNHWSFCVQFTNNCVATFSPYDIEQQTQRLAKILEHARKTNKKIATVNLIPVHNIPVTFDESFEEIPDAEVVE